MKHEQEFNHLLAKALRSANPSWRLSLKVEESRMLNESAANRVDILITRNDAPPVAIETSYQRGDADTDAVQRLGFHYKETMMEIKTAIAVELDKSCRNLTRIDKRRIFKYAVHQKMSNGTRRFPAAGFLRGTYLDLARLAATTPVPKEDMVRVAADVVSLVKAAANLLRDAIPASQLESISRTMYQRSALSGLRTTVLLWLNAMLVQRMLTGGVYNIPPLTDNPSDCVSAWEKIRTVNWWAIFEPAIRILDAVRGISPGQATNALQLLKKAVEIIEGGRVGSGMSIGAELFPLLADDRKESAAFYTQAPAAEFLAAMTVKRDAANWMDPRLFDKFRVVDLTCGTGTLLRYAYRQARIYHEQAGGSAKTLETFHERAMEKGLCGADVSPIASHMTSTSLAVMSKQPYNRTNIGWVGVGNSDRTGSIEYMKTSAVSDLLVAGFGISAGRGGGRGGTGDPSDAWSSEESPMSVVAKDDDASVVIMNPPYSRTRRGQSAFDIAGLSDAERNACQIRWEKLIQDEPCNKTAGMAATFLCMAHKKAKAGGRIGFVLPLTAAFAKSWEPTRDMLETCFEDVMVVAVASGQALGRDALSADAKMEEMFLIATKRDKPGSDHSPVRCVTLYEPLTRIGEAAEVARVVTAGPDVGAIVLGDSEIGMSHMFRTSDGGPWSAVGSSGDTLEMIKNGLMSGRVLDTDGDEAGRFKITTIGQMFDVGTTHHLIGHLKGNDAIGAFTLTPLAGAIDAACMYRSLWAVDRDSQRSLVVKPTHKGSVYNKVEATRMWAHRTTLFYQRNMRWTTQTVLSVMTHNNAMGGSAWTGLSHTDKRVLKAFALWANSIYGIITYWATGQRTHSGRSRMQIKAIRDTHCPRFDGLDSSTLDRAASNFDAIAQATVPLQPACLAENDSVRTMINTAVSNMLGVPEYDHTTLTRLWCAEPSVQKPPRKGQRNG